VDTCLFVPGTSARQSTMTTLRSVAPTPAAPPTPLNFVSFPQRSETTSLLPFFLDTTELRPLPVTAPLCRRSFFSRTPPLDDFQSFPLARRMQLHHRRLSSPARPFFPSARTSNVDVVSLASAHGLGEQSLTDSPIRFMNTVHLLPR